MKQSEALYDVISAPEVERRFAVAKDIRIPYMESDWASYQEQRIYQGPLQLEGGFEPDGEPADQQPFNIIIDGDLTLDGDLYWHDYEGGSFILVTGNLKCRNLFLCGMPALVVRGDLEVENGILLRDGDDGGQLTVRGEAKARFMLNAYYFKLEFSQQVNAFHLGCQADTTGADVNIEITYEDDVLEILRPEHLADDGSLSWPSLQNLMSKGTPIFRDAVMDNRQGERP